MLVTMFALRMRIHARSPLPSMQPVPWLAAGLLEDLAVGGFAAALLLALGRAPWAERWVRVLFGTLALLFVAAELVWSEVLIFFGQLPSPDEVRAGMNLTFARGAAHGLAPVLAAVFLLFFAFLLLVCWRRARNSHRAWSNVSRLLSAAVLAGAALLLPISIHRRETTRNAAVALASLWTEQAEADAELMYSTPRPRLDPIAIRDLAPGRPPREYLGREFPLAHWAPPRAVSAPRLPAGLRPNLVFLLLESVRAEEVGAYGGNPPGVTPNLDQLARKGVLVERAYSAGLQTPDAELALWYGVYPNPYSPIMTAHPRVRLSGLPELLRASGWRSFLWAHNGDQTFYRRDLFYRPRGFQMIDGRDFPRNDPRTGWGYSDRSLARRAVDALDRASEPFAALALTVSNHHPFHVPSDAGSRFPLLPGPRRGFLSFLGLDHKMGLQTAPMLQTVHYTDEAVGDFLRLAASRDWFKRTIFVISGDHGLSIVPYERRIGTLPALTELRHRIPLILYSPLLEPARVSGPASHADVPETLLGLAGIGLPRSGMGRDLLDRDQRDPRRPVVLWSAPGRLVTLVDTERFYQVALPSEPSWSRGSIRLSDEILVDPASDPEGKQDRIRSEPETAERFRRLLEAYVGIYPWLLFSDRSGVPPDSAPPPSRGGR